MVDTPRRETLELSKHRTAVASSELAVGARLRVWWAGDKSWFSGAVLSFSESRGYQVLYDDGEKKFHDLNDPGEVWELEAKSKAAQTQQTPGETSTFNSAVAALNGKRKLVPTMVQIGNQFVKRQNLYDMETGENGAFELDKTYDAAFAPQDRAMKARPPAKPKPASGSAPARKVSAAEKSRLETNEALRRDAAAAAQRRACFFHEHRERIAPFCEPKVIASLAAVAKAAPAAPPRRALLQQPETIVGGEMRDYQLVGLDWMADGCERHGLACLGRRAPL